MGHNKNTKALHKNLYLLKSHNQLYKSTRTSSIALKPKAGNRLSRSAMMPLGRRKVRKATIPMSGSLLYNTGRRNTVHGNQEKMKRHEADSRSKSTVSLKGTVPLLLILQNKLMHDGRKGMAGKIFLKVVSELNHYDPAGNGFKLFYVALERLKPALTTVMRRVGRNYYSVPVPLKATQQYKMAFQWLLEAAWKNTQTPFHLSFAEEVLAVVSSQPSEALKKKEALYRSVVNNRAYSHYRWV